MMARIQPTDDKSVVEPTYDAELMSEKLKTVMHTSADDQIDSNIIFDNPYVDNNSGQAEHDSNVHDQPYANIESLIFNVQKELTDCDISWKSKMAKLNGENVSLNIHIESLLHERENIILEYQKLFNSIKKTRAQHQREVNELIKNVNKKTYAYGDVRYKNQDLLMTISKLKVKLISVEKGKNVDTKFDTMNKNKDLKSKIVPKIKVRKDLSKPVTSCSLLKIEQVKSNT
ncbi:hypothetical protein Tco_0251254, partial [Tanacetum coccineum]